jgi:predicted O-linked N-acetylglucosamine transferase (SPINDLY family)
MRHVACFNLGTLLGALNRVEAADAAYRQALALQPEFPHARLNLGHLLERRGEHEAAMAQWRAVLAAAAPQELKVHAWNNLGRLLETLRRYPEAEAALRESLQLDAAQSGVIQHYVHLRQKQCAWPIYQPVGEVTPNQLLTGTSLLAMMSASDDPALQLLVAQRFAHERVPRPPAGALHATMPPRTGRIRIGYLSGDLHMHAVGLLIPELLELHDRSRFEVWGFCWTPESEQPQRQRIRAAFDHLVRLGGVDDATAARLIAEAGIDVLVDLQGLTNGARPAILGWRAAPVQVSYLGLPGTSALPEIGRAHV